MKIKQEDGNKHKNPASFRAYQRIITSGLSFQGEVNWEMDGVGRTQPLLEVSNMYMGEEEHSYLLTPQNKGPGLIAKKPKTGPGEKIQIDEEYSWPPVKQRTSCEEQSNP